MAQSLCSHKSVVWEITNNSVADRMIDNSLIHKFKPLRKIRRRTKVLNAEIRKNCGVKEYKRYVELKTNVLRNVMNDTDTSDSSNLTDVDYNIIYNSPLKQAKYLTKNSKRYLFTSEEESESYKRLKRCKKRSSKDRSIKEKKEKRKLQVKHTAEYEECVDTGWQQIIKHDSSISHNLQKQMHTSILNNEEDILEDNNHFDAQSSEHHEALSSQLVSQNCMISTRTKSRKKHTKQDHGDPNAMDNELNCKDNTISNKTKRVRERKIQNNKTQSVEINELNIEFNSHDSKYRSSATVENNESNNELNTLVRSESNNGKLPTVINESSIKNHNDTCLSHKPELLKNVRRNLISVLETVDSTNSDKDVETDKNVKDELNSAIVIVNQHSTPLNKIQTKKKDLPDTSPQDQQKDSGIDEDSQDKFVKSKKYNNIPMSQNIKENVEKIHISSQRLKEIDEVVETVEKENVKGVHSIFNDNILEKKISKENESREIKNSLHLTQINTNVDITQEDKDRHFAKAKDSSDQQLLSPEKDNLKDTYSESCDHIKEKEDNREAKELAGEKISLELNEIDKDAEVSSVHYKEKRDSEEEEKSSGITMNSYQLNQDVIEICSTNHEDQNHSIQSENLCDIQKQQLPSNHMKDVRINEEKEEKHFVQLKQTDNNTNMQLTNQEDKICKELEIAHDTQKQHLLPKVMCTEILNKRYKIIDKKDVENNIENIDNINNNMDTVNECTPKKNALIHRSDELISEQKIVINGEEDLIDAPLIFEKDNEEDNINYISPQTRKRLQQQAKLNLVVNSDSSDSNDDYVTIKRSRHNNSHTNYCNEDKLNDETNNISKQTEINISDNENICKDIFVCKETTSKVVELESMNLKEKIKKKAELMTKCTIENNNSFQSTTNKDPLEETYYENVYNNDDQNQDENFQLRVSENNITCNDEDFINQLRGQKQSFSDKKNTCNKNDQNEQIINTELETRHTSEYEQSTQMSTKCLNAQLNISHQYRPYNLQQLVEDQQLLVETIPASFTLADLSEDEEAFILNVPSKVMQCNLQDQILTVKTKSIKFNEIKYRIVCKEVGTTSCIFATGKNRKPYKIVNIKNISTITVREKLQHSKKSDVSNSSIAMSPVSKSLKKNRQTDEIDAKMLKISKRKKCTLKENSDSETGCL